MNTMRKDDLRSLLLVLLGRSLFDRNALGSYRWLRHLWCLNTEMAVLSYGGFDFLRVNVVRKCPGTCEGPKGIIISTCMPVYSLVG